MQTMQELDIGDHYRFSLRFLSNKQHYLSRLDADPARVGRPCEEESLSKFKVGSQLLRNHLWSL